jgi:hypothetical protein
MKELFELFTRLVTAVEKIAANGGGGFVAEKTEAKAEKPKKEKAEKPAADPKPEAKAEIKKDPFADDDEPAAAPVVVTKEQVRAALTAYANATSNDVALALVAANTSNKAATMGQIKPEDYATLFAVVTKATAETKK